LSAGFYASLRALIWGAQAASLLFSTADRNASAKIDLFGANL